ncbi:hypothetical protein D3C75_912140 [compost metagenome]
MRTVVVVAPAKQSSRFVQEQGVHAAQVIGHTINILFHVVIHHMLHFVLFEVQFLGIRQQHHKTAPDLAAHVDRR